MKKIPLTQGKFALVDDSDFEDLSRWKWYYVKKGYAVRAGRKGERTNIVSMHRQIMGDNDPRVVDHVNGNGIDNRQANLRWGTVRENGQNKTLARRSKSGYKGVYYCEQLGNWGARIVNQGKLILLGHYPDKHEAAEAYNRAALKYFGEFAKLNVIERG